MLTLALDTTTKAGSAAVLRDDAVLSVADGEAGRTHGERLPAELQAVLAAADVRLADIDLLAVARGPGAFTGLRIGLAAMQGLAMALGRPVVGVSALDAIAVAARAGLDAADVRVGTWMDAARGEVFAAAYTGEVGPDALSNLTCVSEPEVGDPAAIWARWRREMPSASWVVAGDGAVRYAWHLTEARVVQPGALAPVIGRLARRRLTGSDTPHALEPLYVRRPDAERGQAP